MSKSIKLVTTGKVKKGKIETANEVTQRFALAYSDAHEVPEFQGPRDLRYNEHTAIDGAAWVSLVKTYIPNGYNAFDASLAKLVVDIFGADAEYFPAREGSPCVYIRPKNRVWLDRNADALKQCAIDELSFEPNGTFRLWWD